MLRSLTFPAVRKVTWSLSVASGSGSYLTFGDQLCPGTTLGVIRNELRQLNLVGIGERLIFGLPDGFPEHFRPRWKFVDLSLMTCARQT